MTQPVILPLQSDAATLENAGGKGANLARLFRAGFPIPDGFIIPTTAYLDHVSAGDLDKRILARLADMPADETTAAHDASDAIRAWFLVDKANGGWISIIRRAYADLGGDPVAVRSSATTEDLPEMSFAGQQETFLNVVGVHQATVRIKTGQKLRVNGSSGEITLMDEEDERFDLAQSTDLA